MKLASKRTYTGTQLTDKFVVGETPRYDGKFPVEPIDEKVKVDQFDHAGYLSEKFDTDNFEVIEDSLGNKSLRLKSTESTVFGFGLYDDLLGRVSVDPFSLIDTNYFQVNETTHKITLKLDTDGGIGFDAVNGLSVKVDSSSGIESTSAGLSLVYTIDIDDSSDMISVITPSDVQNFSRTFEKNFTGSSLTVAFSEHGIPTPTNVTVYEETLRGYEEVMVDIVIDGTTIGIDSTISFDGKIIIQGTA